MHIEPNRIMIIIIMKLCGYEWIPKITFFYVAHLNLVLIIYC